MEYYHKTCVRLGFVPVCGVVAYMCERVRMPVHILTIEKLYLCIYVCTGVR